MFDRGVVTERKKRKIAVVLTMDDGSVMRGTVVGAHSNLGDILSNGHTFLEIVDADSETMFLAMSSIRKIEFSDLPKADHLSRQQKANESSNPYQILGVSADVNEADLATAYHELTRAYHPDRMASFDLPDEITEYAAAMQKRFNMAFEDVRQALQKRQAEPKPVVVETVFEHMPAWARQAS